MVDLQIILFSLATALAINVVLTLWVLFKTIYLEKGFKNTPTLNQFFKQITYETESILELSRRVHRLEQPWWKRIRK